MRDEYKLIEQIEKFRSKTIGAQDEDHASAQKQGKVYAPKEHTWGINAAWVLALARRRVPIHVVADLNLKEETIYRTHPRKDDKNPISAFVMEIAIMKKMGYSVVLGEQGEVMLHPPAALRADAHRTTGAGNGALPTREEQEVLYHQCFEEREQRREELRQRHREELLQRRGLPATSVSAIENTAVAATPSLSSTYRAGRFEISEEDTPTPTIPPLATYQPALSTSVNAENVSVTTTPALSSTYRVGRFEISEEDTVTSITPPPPVTYPSAPYRTPDGDRKSREPETTTTRSRFEVTDLEDGDNKPTLPAAALSARPSGLLFGFQNYQASQSAVSRTLGANPKTEEKPANPNAPPPKKHH